MRNSPKISNGVHFIGIGGIGVSALARYFLKKGHQITGSDLTSSEITEALKKLGAKVFLGPHKPENITSGINLVIYSPAVKPNNPEFKKAKKLQVLGYKLQVKSYPEALGGLTKKYFTIAVSGTHGKSTTTSMIGLLLAKAGLDPTVIVGTKVKEFGDSNCRVGKSQYLVIEADEHKASFLNYWPKIIVLTNIEADHLDYYKNLGNIIKTFKKYIAHLPSDGTLVANRDDPVTHNTFSTIAENVLWYSKRDREARMLKKILKIPGEHNISNALAALTVARILKVPDKTSFKALSEYKGSWRRFDVSTKTLNTKPYTLINDYGHHPTEIKVTLKAAREKYPKKKIWCVFQPHQYQRTYYLFKDFVRVFKKALRHAQGKLPIDKIIITDIYNVAGRETPEIKKKVSAEKLVKAINRKNIIYLPKEKIIDFLKENLNRGEVLIIMGAGDIYDLNRQLST